MFPYSFSQNGLKFRGRLALQEKKSLDDSSYLDVFKFRASPDMLLSASVTRKDLQFSNE